MVGINIPYAKAQTRRIIQSAPTQVHPFRQTWASDGYGGLRKVGDPFLVGEAFVALFDNASSPKIQLVVSEGGKFEQESSLRLFVEHEDSIDVKKDDWWIHNGTKYKFANVTNILELNILYQIDLEVMEA